MLTSFWGEKFQRETKASQPDESPQIGVAYGGTVSIIQNYVAMFNYSRPIVGRATF